jgi:hypothetical protein
MRRWLTCLLLAFLATTVAYADRVPTYTVDAKPTTGCGVGYPYDTISSVAVVRGTGSAWRCNYDTGLWVPADLPACPGGVGTACDVGSACQSGTTVLLCPAGTRAALTATIATAPGSSGDLLRNVGGGQGADGELNYDPSANKLTVGGGEATTRLSLGTEGAAGNLTVTCDSTSCSLCFEGTIGLGTENGENCIILPNTSPATADRNFTIPAGQSGTAALLEGPQTHSGAHTFSGTLNVPSGTTPPGSCSGAPVFYDTDATAGQRLLCCNGGAYSQCNSTSVSGAGGSEADVQVHVGGALQGIPGFKGDGVTGHVRHKAVDGVGQARGYATGGTGVEGDCYTGWEGVLDDYRHVRIAGGCFNWNTAKSVRWGQDTDRGAGIIIEGDGMEGTNIHPLVTPALTIGPTIEGIQDIRNVTLRDLNFELTQDLWWDAPIINFVKVTQATIENLWIQGGPSDITEGRNLYSGRLIDFDSSYQGIRVVNCGMRGRFVNFFEWDDTFNSVEMDTVTFDNLFAAGNTVGVFRTTGPGSHSVVFNNPKFQVSISTAIDRNAIDESTLSVAPSAGASTITVANAAAFECSDSLFIGNDTLTTKSEFTRIASSSCKSGNTITLAHPLRFAHGVGEEVFHGGVFMHHGSNTRLMTYNDPMFEQGFIAIYGSLSHTTVNNVLSSSYILGRPAPTSANGARDFYINRGEIQRGNVRKCTGTSTLCNAQSTCDSSHPGTTCDSDPANPDVAYGLYITSTADAVIGTNTRRVKIMGARRNSSALTTFTPYFNGAGTFRDVYVDNEINGATQVLRNYPTSDSSVIDQVVSGGVVKHTWEADGDYTTAKSVKALSFILGNGTDTDFCSTVDQLTGVDPRTCWDFSGQTYRVDFNNVFDSSDVILAPGKVQATTPVATSCVQIGNSSSGSATCVCRDSINDRLFEDLDCDFVKNGSDEYMGGAVTLDSVGSPQIINGAIVDADVSPSANIAGGKVQPNSSSSPGVVASASGQFTKCWATEGTGTPAWRDCPAGNPAFSTVTSGTNANALLVSGSLAPTGGGAVTANAYSGADGSIPGAKIGAGLYADDGSYCVNADHDEFCEVECIGGDCCWDPDDDGVKNTCAGPSGFFTDGDTFSTDAAVGYLLARGAWLMDPDGLAVGGSGAKFLPGSASSTPDVTLPKESGTLPVVVGATSNGNVAKFNANGDLVDGGAGAGTTFGPFGAWKWKSGNYYSLETAGVYVVRSNATSSNAGPQVNTLNFYPICTGSVSQTITELDIYVTAVGTAGDQARIGLYANDATNFVPTGSPLEESGALGLDTLGIRTYGVGGGSRVLAANTCYWLAYVDNDGGASGGGAADEADLSSAQGSDADNQGSVMGLSTLAEPSRFNLGYYMAHTFGALPTPSSLTPITSGVNALVFVKAQ